MTTSPAGPEAENPGLPVRVYAIVLRMLPRRRCVVEARHKFQPIPPSRAALFRKHSSDMPLREVRYMRPSDGAARGSMPQPSNGPPAQAAHARAARYAKCQKSPVVAVW